MLRFLEAILGCLVRQSTRPARVRQIARTRLLVEELSPRVLPAAGGFGLPMGHFFDHHAHVLTSTVSNSNLDTSACSHASHTGEACNGEASLVASLSDASGATGTASFNATTNALKVQVAGATPSTSLSVAVDGTSVGTLTTDASGNGQTTLANVTVAAGSTITVGDLTGTFSQVKFAATLSGATGVSGSADYNSVKNKLLVSITGAAASTTYNVTIDGTVVGQITTNSSGAGKLKLTSSTLSITAGSSLSISDTLGDAAILTGVFA